MREKWNERCGIRCLGALVTLVAFAGLFVSLLASAGSAANYPVKPVRIIVPFQAGGQTDMTGRT